MYHNARNPEHLRQMLRAWLAPLENTELEAAAQFYTKKFDDQGKQWGVTSEKEVDVEEDERQPITTMMNVRDALTLLGLQAFSSVDMVTLQDGFHNQLAWQESFPEARQQLHQVFDTITQHQNDNDCWELCSALWTNSMDEKLMRWKTEDAKITWTANRRRIGCDSETIQVPV
jgi:hypothetical protein